MNNWVFWHHMGLKFWTYNSVNSSKSVLLVGDASGKFDRNSNGCCRDMQWIKML